MNYKVKKIDLEAGELMANANEKCRKFKSGHICFSAESVLWIKRKQIYQSLVDHCSGKPTNRGNLKQVDRKQPCRVEAIWQSDNY